MLAARYEIADRRTAPIVPRLPPERIAEQLPLTAFLQASGQVPGSSSP
jgi:hypothetical protein